MPQGNPGGYNENPATGRPLKNRTLEKNGKITTAGRLSLPPQKFALPPGAEEKRRGVKGRYPIYDEAHARNALARVSQNGTPAEQDMVKRAVAREYPGIEQGDHKRRK